MDQRTLSKKEDLYIRSLYAFEVGRWAEAERLFRTYALMYPHESYPAFGHGMVLRTRGRGRDALTVLLEAETRDSDSIYLPFHVGLSFLTLGDFEAARRYAGALRETEQHYRADALMAAVLFTEGSYDEASRLLRHGIDERGHAAADMVALAALETFAGEREASRRAVLQALEIQNGVFQLVAAGVELTRNGTEPGLAFTVAADGTVTP